jgi:hypothetical protein
VKNQLSDFDSNFQIKEERGLTLVFLKPVLLTKDIIWLMKSEPISKQQTNGGELWKYVLEKQYPGQKNEEGNFDIPIFMLFKDDKLNEISFPERFLTYLSKPLLIKALRSMGDAEIDKSKRSVDSKFETTNSLEIPRTEHFIKILGMPFSRKDSDHTLKFNYVYNLKKAKSGSNNKVPQIVTRFTFQNGDNRLLKAEGHLMGLKMSLNFSVDEKER